MTLVSWGINTAAIFAGGRLDSELSKGNEPSGEAKDEPLPVVRYFMPAGWAFAIWGPIILGWWTPPMMEHLVLAVRKA